MSTRILLVMMLMYSAAFAQVQEETLTAPKKMCGYQTDICVQIAAGVVGIAKNAISGDSLAYGNLAEDTVLSWVKLPKGARINFYNKQAPGFYADDEWDFEITYNQPLTYAGVVFKENTKIGFDRFQKVFSAELRSYVFTPHQFGYVRVYGTALNTNSIQGLMLQANSALSFATMVGYLDQTIPTRINIMFGVIAEDGFYPSAINIPVVEGDLIGIDHARRELTLKMPWPRQRLVMPQNILADQVEYNLNTGLISQINVAYENKTLINGLLLRDSVTFDDLGQIASAENLAGHTFGVLVPQTAQGIYFDREISYHGFVKFWSNGNLMTVPTLHVEANRQLLPAELVASLPSVLEDDSSNRIRFFLDQRGRVRVIFLETDVGPGFRNEIYLAKPNGDGTLEFTKLELNSELGRLIQKSQRGYVEPEMVEYLRSL